MSAKNVSFLGGTASLTLYWFVSIWRSVFTFAQGMKPECRGPNTQAVVSEPQRGAVPKKLTFLSDMSAKALTPPPPMPCGTYEQKIFYRSTCF